MARTNFGLPGVYNASVITLADGEGSASALDINGNVKTTLGTKVAGEDITNDVLKVDQRVTYVNLSASTAVKSASGRFYGFVVNSHTSGTLKFWDNTAGSGTILLNTITFAAGPASWVLPVGISFSTGLFATVGGTIDFTVLYN